MTALLYPDGLTIGVDGRCVRITFKKRVYIRVGNTLVFRRST